MASRVAVTRALVPAGTHLLILLTAAVFLAGSAPAELTQTPAALMPAAPTAPRITRHSRPRAPLAVPAALTDAGLDLHAGPVPVPLELAMPSLGAGAPVIGVGITSNNVMDAPMGDAEDPVWQQAFWYRGSAIPGARSTALIAGHINDPLGRPGVFAHIDKLRPGDPIVVHDTRRALDIRFVVTDSETFALDQTTDPIVLDQIYGVGPVAGTKPQRSADGLAHLTLITCAGTFRNGTHDHRLVVHATRIS
jgi:sortase (surface protein transpeptidase)